MNSIQLHSCAAGSKVLTSQLNITLLRMHDSPVINHAGRLVSEIGVACSVLRFEWEGEYRGGVLEDDLIFFGG